MQSLFITEEDVFSVKICVAQDKNGIIYCDMTRGGVETLLGKREVDIKEYAVVFRKPSFGDLSALTDILLSSREGNDIGYNMNPIAARIKTISYLIKSWDILDKNGEKIPTTEENIMKLDPIIATSIGIQLDFLLENNQDEDKIKEIVKNIQN